MAELSANLREIQAAGCLQRRYSIYLNEADPIHRSNNNKNQYRARIMSFETGQAITCEKIYVVEVDQT